MKNGRSLAILLWIGLIVMGLEAQTNSVVLDKSIEKVLLYFDHNATKPYEGKIFPKELMHHDYAFPGVEGDQKSVIANEIKVISAKWISGNFNIINPHVEKAIEVVAVAQQLFYIENNTAKKEPKALKFRFILSNFEQEKDEYKILEDDHKSFDYVYIDEVRKVLVGGLSEDVKKLKASLIIAGMEGLQK